MTITLPSRELWQEDVLKYLIDNPVDKWMVVKSIRQVGKSTLAEMLLVYTAIMWKGSKSICVSPVVSQARKIFEEMVNWAHPIIQKSNGTQLSIRFTNGSEVLFKSAEQGDSIRGETIKMGGILVVDEAAFMSNEFFYSILVPTTNVYHSNIVMFSTPKYQQGFFFDLYNQGLKDDAKVVSFDWTGYDTSKYLPKETLELYRKQMPRLSFQCEFLGQFISGEGQVFNDFNKCLGMAKNDVNGPLYIGVDWGTGSGSDDTAITIGQAVDGLAQVSRIITFNDKNAQEQVAYIKALIEDCVSNGYKDIRLLVELNSIGKVYYDLLKTEVGNLDDLYNGNVELKLKSFTTSNDSKKKIVEQLETLFEQGKIIIPDDEKLLKQLSQFESTVNSNNTVIYKGSGNSHDDTVMSLCFCVNMMYKQVIKPEVLV